MEMFIVMFILVTLNRCSSYTTTTTTTKNQVKSAQTTSFEIGVIMDLNSMDGGVKKSCIEMAKFDFNALRTGTKLVVHFRDSKGDVLRATSEALDLILIVRVHAIIVPEAPEEIGSFLALMGCKYHIPIIFFSAISGSLSLKQFPYFVRIAQSDSSQAKAVAAIVQTYQWKEVVLIHDDSQSGSGAVPDLLNDILQEIRVVLSLKVILPRAANATIIKDVLRNLMRTNTSNLMRTNTRVYIVHLPSSLGSHFFLHVNELQMMQAGYAWITTCGLTDLLGYADSSVIHSMEGVLGVRTHVPPSKALRKFKHRVREHIREKNHKIKESEPNVYGLWAYDATFFMAVAAHSHKSISHLSQPSLCSQMTRNFSCFSDRGASPLGSVLLQSMLETPFSRLSGEIQLVNGQLQSSTLEIVNVMKRRGQTIGYWTPKTGLSPSLHPQDLEKNHPISKKDLGLVNWPGRSTDVPCTASLMIGVPVSGFLEFMKVARDPINDSLIVKGFSKVVFDAVMRHLSYCYKYIPFNGSFDDLTQQVSFKKFDAAVGDITITASRSKYVDFSQPFSIAGVRMIVPIKKDDFSHNPWWYVKPLSKELWFTTIAIFLLIGPMVGIFEHQINTDFVGTLSQRVGKALFFSFSILVFAHRERLESNLSRVIVNMWTFAVVIFATSYNANLTSMLTVENLKPAVTELDYLRTHEKFVGYQKASFVFELLKDMGFKANMLKHLSTLEEYADALSRGSENGGVSAVVDEIPYLDAFLSKYCYGYTIAGPTIPTGGFGFMFPKDSPLLSDVSQAILELTERTHVDGIQRKWFRSEACRDFHANHVTTPNRLRLYSYRSILIIMTVTSAVCLLFFFATKIYKRAKDGIFAGKFKVIPFMGRLKTYIPVLKGIVKAKASWLPKSDSPTIGQPANNDDLGENVGDTSNPGGDEDKDGRGTHQIELTSDPSHLEIVTDRRQHQQGMQAPGADASIRTSAVNSVE